MSLARLARELRDRRDLAIVLTWREVVVRYKRSALGVAWALAEPLAMVVVYVVVFGRVLHASAAVENYALFTLLGVVAWTFFSSTLEQSTITLIEHAPLIRKIYFPRELLVFAVVCGRLATLLISVVVSGVFVVVGALTGSVAPLGELWLLPLGAVALAVFAAGLALFLSAVNVLYRDVGFIVRFVLRLGFFACPIAYPISLVPAEFRLFYDLNPLVALLWLFQRAASPTVPSPSNVAVASGIIGAIVALPVGWYLFRRLRGPVSDLI
jgi:lipopolysaccharide transport system permease protein